MSGALTPAKCIAAPAVDLRGGRCVQLVGGRPEDERVSLPDPVAVAERWWRLGFSVLHVVDLDAALGTGDNLEVIRQILTATPATVQVGGGVRAEERADALIEAGAARVVVGTRALDDADWLRALSVRHPGRIMVAADTRDGEVLRKGWTEGSGVAAGDFLASLRSLDLAGLLATDVGREGRMEGIDRGQVAATVEASPFPTWISGGVTTLDEMAWLDSIGAAGAVLGMALYAGELDAPTLAARWGAGTNTLDPTEAVSPGTENTDE